MIVLINGGKEDNRINERDFVGKLISPRCGNSVLNGEKWAGDNDAFKAWNENLFIKMLNRLDGTPNCLFICSPDVVGNANETISRFWDWRYEIIGRGFPIALVGQDGIENLDIPWDAFDCYFIGGSTEWKLSDASRQIAWESKKRGKWLHMGRVNSLCRMRIARNFLCDSIDGTGWSMFSNIYINKHLPRLKLLTEQRLLWELF